MPMLTSGDDIGLRVPRFFRFSLWRDCKLSALFQHGALIRSGRASAHLSGHPDSCRMTPRNLLKKLPRPMERALALIAGRAEVTGFMPTYHEDCLATNHWLSVDDRFRSAYDKAVSLGLAVDTHMEWR